MHERCDLSAFCLENLGVSWIKFWCLEVCISDRRLCSVLLCDDRLFLGTRELVEERGVDV